MTVVAPEPDEPPDEPPDQPPQSGEGAGRGAPTGPPRARAVAVTFRPRPRRTVRGALSFLVAVLAAAAAVGAVAARYVHHDLLDTDRYVATVAPLGSDPAVRSAVADAVTSAIVDRLDLQGLTTQALAAVADGTRVPDQVVALAPVLASQGDAFVGQTVSGLVASDRFTTAWTAANRAAHASLVAVVTGSRDGVVAADGTGQVSLRLGPVVAAAQQRLVDRGLTVAGRLPPVDASFVVLSSPHVADAQRWFRVLDRAAAWLPWLALALAAGAVAVAPRGRRRRAVVVAALAVAGGMVLLAAGLAVGRGLYLDAVPADVLPRPAAAAVADALAGPLRALLRVVLVVALVVALGAYLAGPGAGARTVRSWFLAAVRWATRGRAGATGRAPTAVEVWAARLATGVTVVVVALGGVVLAFWRDPTVAVVVWLAALVTVVVVVVQVLAAPARAADRDPTGATGSAVPDR